MLQPQKPIQIQILRNLNLVRLCCGCYQPKEQRELIRLKVGSTGLLEPLSGRNTGRSAWVCFNESCIQAIIRHPKKLFRSLRTHVKTQHLHVTLVHWLWEQIVRTLSQLHRDGCIVKSEHQDAYVIHTTEAYDDIYMQLTNTPRFLSLNSNASEELYSIFTAPHKELSSLRRNIQLYETLYQNGIENITS